ncbi:hypothetical protein ZTR_03791 [Talaromyces verruculosus]|nr:hypothetical protein ZTR_03791 [Talaromyces verruculosus]
MDTSMPLAPDSVVAANTAASSTLDNMNLEYASDSYIPDPIATDNTTASSTSDNMDLEAASDPHAPEINVRANTTASSILDNMDLEYASDPHTPDPTVTEHTATLSDQPLSLEEMDSRDTSDPTESNLIATSVVPSTIENMESKGLSDAIASESNEPHSTAMDSSSSNMTPSERGAILEKGESKNSPKSNVLESDMPEITNSSNQLPSLEEMESKSASDRNASEPNVPFSTVTENLASNMESKGALNSTAAEPNMTMEGTIAASQQVPILDQVQFENSPIPDSINSTAPYVEEGSRATKAFTERRRRIRERWDREREYRIIANDLGYELSDRQLSEILHVSPRERDEFGRIINMEYVFQWVPPKHKGSPIDHKSAVGILREAVDKAVHARLLSHNASIVSFDFDVTQDGYYCIIAYWYRDEPVLPDSLKGLQAFIIFKKKSYHPKDIRLDSSQDEFASKVFPVVPDPLQKTQFSDTGYGTVGFIGLFYGGSDEGHHVLVTTGHNFDEDPGDNATIEIHAEHIPEMPHALRAPTTIMELFKRGVKKRPVFRLGRKGNECMDEICLIDGELLPEDYVQDLHPPDLIDCNALYPVSEDEDPIAVAQTPALISSEEFLTALKQRLGTKVFKRGAETGVTMGTLIRVEKAGTEYPKGMDWRGNDETPEYFLIIKWESDEEPFAVGGDSGSLVYAKHDGKVVPLGIHRGSIEYHSHACSVWSWCREIYQSLNAELVFCMQPDCEYAAQ